MKDKKKSKRQPLKQKYAIEKRSREHRKRLKKLLKNPEIRSASKKKDPGIPNNWPFKTQMLEAIRKKKLALQQEKAERRLNAATNEHNSGIPYPCVSDTEAYTEMVSRAVASAANYIPPEDHDKQKHQMNTTSRYYSNLNRIIEEADVIIEVLDARFPNESRHLETERKIIDKQKKLILLLNKIDLVPRDVVNAWVEYLRQFYPTIAFKAASSKSSRPFILAKKPREALTKGELQVKSQVVGLTELMQLIKNYERTGSSTKTKMAITVGVVGEPNVGKSSVINSLCKNSSVVKVGAEAGITKHVQEVHLDSKVKLLDTPGVVMNGNDDDPAVILRNAVNFTTIKHPIEVIDALLQKHSPGDIMTMFKVPMYGSTSEFLAIIAKRQGKIKKGGLCDYESTARTILHEWNSGALQHYCLPPHTSDIEMQTEQNPPKESDLHTARLVSELRKPLDMS